MKRLRTAKINGVKGVYGKIRMRMGPDPDEYAKAVIYGQWAIRRLMTEGELILQRCLIANDPVIICHIHVGRKFPGVYEQEIARSILADLLKVPGYKTDRAKKAIAEVEKIWKRWRCYGLTTG